MRHIDPPCDTDLTVMEMAIRMMIVVDRGWSWWMIDRLDLMDHHGWRGREDE